MRVKINSTGEIKEVKQVGDKLFDKENNWYSLSNVILLDNWHPGGELPVIPKGKTRSVELAVYCKQANTLVLRNAVYYGNGHWSELNVKWWCYPPKED